MYISYNRCIDILINSYFINKITISYICYLRRVVADKKNFRLIILAQQIYVTCAYKSNLYINPKPQLFPCTPACCQKFHVLAVYLYLKFTVPPIGGAFEIQSNICGRAFLRKQSTFFAGELHLGYLTECLTGF